MAASLFRFLEPSKDFEQFREQLRPLNRSKNTEIRDVAKNAISELAGIMNILRHFTGISFALLLIGLIIGDKYPNLLFDPGMTYRPQTFNTGLVFLLNVELLFSNKSVPKSVVILAGGTQAHHYITVYLFC